MGPNVSFYSGTHPLDPDLRNGTQGPETGKEITIEEDVWLGGNVTILPGVTVGRGSTVGAGSVVTKVCCCQLPDLQFSHTDQSQERPPLHCSRWQSREVHQGRTKTYHHCRGEGPSSKHRQCTLAADKSIASISLNFEVLDKRNSG